ncbi:Uma2 family endonuclease [Mangrovibrevibacter kandeliae]|uniref:Uma2 family endonuclease n=1 Tax=Mangrovibrevibacter kandeliae TaxID=2968473 RepID=UPI0021184C37|nr:Uma2 family endonuclease [Aurantimonas sp. CSK15Z-1]MCQ8782598.1 Uma2 family endonuclease [Aurantimonas sp. CSK15Z-1]
MSITRNRSATYADLQAVPPHRVAEIIDGVLVTHPRPAPKHGVAAAALGADLMAPFQWGRSGGPGGWIFVVEPELHIGSQVVVPDLAGWRRERLPRLPDEAYFDLPPDWVCEVASPSTEAYDRGPKRRIYAEAGVAFLWLLDPRSEVLETFSLAGERWLLTGTFAGREDVAAPPFDAITFSLGDLWPFDDAEPAAPSDAP